MSHIRNWKNKKQKLVRGSANLSETSLKNNKLCNVGWGELKFFIQIYVVLSCKIRNISRLIFV